MMELSILNRLKVGQRRQNGVAAVEFGFLIILLLFIVGGVIEFGRVFWYLDGLTKATRDGARYLSTVVLPINTDDATAKDIVVDAATAAGVADFTNDNVTISCEPDCAAPNYVTVAVTGYNLGFGSWFPLPWWAGGDIPLAPHTTMRYM